MSDIADKAQAAEEMVLREALSAHRGPVTVPKGVGMCLNCGADVADDRRWCDAPCRDEYQARVQRA